MEIQKSAKFVEKHLEDVALFDNKRGHYYKFCMEVLENQKNQGLWLEFGVRDGVSSKYFSTQALKLAKNKLLYGFDSFEGIRNSWSSINEPVGSFTRLGKSPPSITGCEFIVGWIEDTLEPFLDQHHDKVCFIHFDLDVYAPTRYALSILKERVQPGTIIKFDELHGYPGWAYNEKKALEETFEDGSYKFIAFSRKQAAIQIL